MGAFSLEKVRPHSLEATVERYATLYVQLLENAPALQVLANPYRGNRGAEIAHRSGHP